MRNFDFLSDFPTLKTLRENCLACEINQQCDPSISAFYARRALEWLVKNILFLKNAYTENVSLNDMMYSEAFTDFVDNKSVLGHCHYIRKTGNAAAHNGQVTKSMSFFTVINLYEFVGFALMKLGFVKSLPRFNEKLLTKQPEPFIQPADVSENPPTLEPLPISGNVSSPNIQPPQSPISEADTRKAYIDLMIAEAGWSFTDNDGEILPGKACREIEVSGMPNRSGIGYADYVLFGNDGKPLAVIEAKKTSVDPNVGKQQAKLYADCLMQKYGVRPVVYISNGFETYFIDGLGYPQRRVYAFHSIKDLEALHFKQRFADKNTAREDGIFLKINNEISDRYYQKTAIKAVFEHFQSKHRKALLVMATGTGKTRTAISLVDVMMRFGHVENVLFLADRTALVNQAHKNFVKLLPNVTTCKLSDNTDNDKDLNARIIFSTYQTMINNVDTENKTFSVGRFDLIIIDEAHRSVFGKYGAIFQYFDSLLVGLTATPREEVDRSTYELFEMEEGVPNYAYELNQAVSDGYLVNFKSFSKGTDFLDNGIRYDDLSDDEKDQLEQVWEYESDSLNPDDWEPRDIESSEIFKYLFNKQTIDLVLQDLMENGLKVESGDKIGKTIIFAANHKHAQLIVDRFNALYPSLACKNGQYAFCELIDNYVNYSQDLIDKFEMCGSTPQIAVSVDMMDTGIDVPDVLNLVFFKKVKSKIKFWQMIGRGTRLSPDIFGPDDHKKEFYILDWCRNLEYFSVNVNGAQGIVPKSLTERLFGVTAEIAYELQSAEYQADDFAKDLHDRLKQQLSEQISALSDSHISVRAKWQSVSKYRKPGTLTSLTVMDVQALKDDIAPLVAKISGDELAKRFDLLVFQVELSVLNTEINSNKQKGNIIKSVRTLRDKKASIAQVANKMNVINSVLAPQFWDNITIHNLEYIREELRDLMILLQDERRNFDINIMDTLTVHDEAPELVSTMTYKEKVLDYIAKNSNAAFVQKIKNLLQLTHDDIKDIERVLWTELGSKRDYQQYATNTMTKDSAAAFLRSLMGVDKQVALQKFSEYISAHNLNADQEDYLNSIIDYVCQNGDIQKSVLINEYPFMDYNIVDIFGAEAAQVGNFTQNFHTVITA